MPPKTFFKTAYRSETGSGALLGLAKYSCFLFTLPLAVFFLGKQVAEEELLWSPPWSSLGPACLSILSANIVIFLYVLKAIREEQVESGNKQE